MFFFGFSMSSAAFVINPNPSYARNMTPAVVRMLDVAGHCVGERKLFLRVSKPINENARRINIFIVTIIISVFPIVLLPLKFMRVKKAIMSAANTLTKYCGAFGINATA